MSFGLRTSPAAGRAYPGLEQYFQAAACVIGLLLAMIVTHVGSFCYIAFAFTGSFAVYLYLWRRPKELLWVAAAGAVYAIVYALLGGQFLQYAWSGIGTPGAFLGLGSLAFVSVKWAWTKAENRRELSTLLSWMTIVPLLCMGSMVAVSIAAELSPLTYDLYLYQFDGRLGFEPSFLVGQWFASSRVLFLACALAYNSLPLLLALSLAIWNKRHVAGAADYRLACIALGVLGFALYQVVPAAGPIYSFPSLFPYAPPHLNASALSLLHLSPVPRNAMPSLHVGWVLLFWWNSKGLGRAARVLSAVYLPLTMLATLGSGEHYLIDLVVVVPLCLVVQAASARAFPVGIRWPSLLAGASMIATWMVELRTGAIIRNGTTVLCWTLIAITVAVSTVLKLHLDRAARFRQAARQDSNPGYAEAELEAQSLEPSKDAAVGDLA